MEEMDGEPRLSGRPFAQRLAFVAILAEGEPVFRAA
jgi:hypothetical protein